MNSTSTEPLWLSILRGACEGQSQRKVAQIIDYSQTTINQVLNGKYPGDLAAVETAVLAAFPPETALQTTAVPTVDEPDWVAALRAACAAHTQSRMAGRLGFSGTVINQVLKGKYPGNLARVEMTVRGALLAEKVHCPVMGEIPSNSCATQQGRTLKQCNHPLRVTLYKTCRAGCPNSWLPINVAYVDELTRRRRS